jgi:hypothetical protein
VDASNPAVDTIEAAILELLESGTNGTIITTKKSKRVRFPLELG